MATASEQSSAAGETSNQCDCGICQERYKCPKLLGCLHSFCEQCLVRYRDNQCRGAAAIPCPLCQQETVLPETGIQALKTNSHLMGLIEERSLQELLEDVQLICKVCNHGKAATHFCRDCGLQLCPDCYHAHERFPDTSGHAVTTLEDLLQGEVTFRKTKKQAARLECRKHPGEAMWFFCEKCQQLICRDCTVMDHPKSDGHYYIELDEASPSLRRSLQEHFPTLERSIEDIKETLETIDQVKQELEDNIERSEKAVWDRVAEGITRIITEGNETVIHMMAVKRSRIQTLLECQGAVNKLLQRKTHSLKMAKDCKDTASTIDFLLLYPEIQRNLQVLCEAEPPAVMRGLPVLKFQPGQGFEGLSLGKVEQEGKWQLHQEFSKRHFDSGVARSLASLGPDEIAVAGDKTITICSTDGIIQSTIQMEESVRVRDLTAFNHTLVVIDDTRYVRMYKKDSQEPLRLSTVLEEDPGKTAVDLRSVAVKKDGTIIVGDVKRNVLTEHSPADGSLLRTAPVKIPPHHLAVDASGRVVVSGGEKQPLVNIVDGSNVLASVKPTIAGRPVKRCGGVCCDSMGIYVAVSGNQGTGHIHQYGSDGGFVGCIAKGLHCPMGIIFTAGRQKLAVADMNSVKVYQVA